MSIGPVRGLIARRHLVVVQSWIRKFDGRIDGAFYGRMQLSGGSNKRACSARSNGMAKPRNIHGG